MTEDEQRPKKAVRRVVKKTVVRPAAQPPRGTSAQPPRGTSAQPPRGTSAQPPRGTSAPSPREGRASAAKATVPTRRTTPVSKGAVSKGAVSKGTPSAGTTSTVERTPKLARVPKPARDRGPSLRERAGTAGRGAADGLRSGASRVGQSLQTGSRRVLDARLPHWPGPVGAAVSGLVAALVGALLGAAMLELFSWVLGVRAGGGWGVPAFVLVMAAVWWAGSVLLSGFGHASARLVSFLGVVIGLIVLLITLPSAAETAWAFLIVPVLGAASFAAAQAVVNVAQTVPAEED